MKKILIIIIILAACLQLNYRANAQVSNPTNASTVAIEWLGWDQSGTTTKPLDIVNGWANQPINFHTNAGLASPWLCQKMIILGTGGANDGFVGIGNSCAPFGTTFAPGTFPYFRLDVDAGDININNRLNGYRIGAGANSNYVLWHNGDPTSIFVGVGAGISTPAVSTLYNTLVGYNAGTSITIGQKNVFVGYGAGASNNSDFNTFVGYNAGTANTAGYDNTFVGVEAGVNNTLAVHNSFFGDEAGEFTTIGGDNTFIGAHSAKFNVSGIQNTFLGTFSGNKCTSSYNTFGGYQSGLNSVSVTYNTFYGYNSGLANTTGNNNTIVGALADCNTGGLTNAAAIGYNSLVRASNKMILGNDAVNVGIGLTGDATFSGPTNKLEINAGPGYTRPSAVTGASGLQFRQLNNTCNPQANGGNLGVLSLDANGNVIYVNGGGLGFGPCSVAPFAPLLTQHVGINLNEWNVYFSDPFIPTYSDKNNVGIGYSCGSSLRAKLDVVSVTQTTLPHDFTVRFAGKFWETGTYQAPPAAGNAEFVGVYGMADVRDVLPLIAKRINLGGDFYASQTVTNIGARGTATGGAINYNIGLNGIANNGPVNLAVYGDLFGAAPPCLNPPCLPIAATAPNNFAGYFNGDVLSTSGMYWVSDASLKENIQDISDPMTIINQLLPKSYTYNQQANQSLILASNTHYGLLAQDVYSVLPQLTKDCIHPARFDTLGNEIYPEIDYKAVNYIEFIPFLIAAIKEQQSQIEDLQSQQIHQHPTGDDSGNSIDVTLASKSIVLNQNVPNPFKEETTIEYFIPDDAQQVKIIFTDNKGSILKEVEITEKGKGQLNVYAADLSSGIYTYTIVADGITIDSKQMVKTK